MLTPIRWQVPTTRSTAEQDVADKLHRIGKFYVFLREIRAELLDETFEAELAGRFGRSFGTTKRRGTSPDLNGAIGQPPGLWFPEF